ncbi:M23 family metallopeptidase [Coxiella endosymbiont of Amblyomma americanum]|uniref:M23 family metallopeptidase n=1 Tax=Coxiella endosymbiont of Amblyomma americanum TaxID=325775 RepID=UPI000B0BF753|nr:M23 family metallopeptidase [Coxiella endosymbiont of Amblyomma americanum]
MRLEKKEWASSILFTKSLPILLTILINLLQTHTHISSISMKQLIFSTSSTFFNKEMIKKIDTLNFLKWQTIIAVVRNNAFLNYLKSNNQSTTIQDLKKSNLFIQTVYKLQKIFNGDNNIIFDLYRDCYFNFLHQKNFIKNDKYHYDNIISTKFVFFNKNSNEKKTIHHHILPANHTHFYRKYNNLKIYHAVHFLNAPLQHYKRISSYFSYHRYDPILRRIKPHLGIDFAASTGTPIQSIGEGKVIFIGYKGGYGKTIQICYDRRYLALYGHMLKFAKLHLFSWVHKGQVIGYVGESGWATGPHLHFGFYVHGIPKNWLTIHHNL